MLSQFRSKHKILIKDCLELFFHLLLRVVVPLKHALFFLHVYIKLHTNIQIIHIKGLKIFATKIEHVPENASSAKQEVDS